jgi:hypothetical protein
MRQRLQLPRVTLILVTGVDVDSAIRALKYSSASIDFGAVKLITPSNLGREQKGITVERPFESRLDSINEYSRYCIYELWRHVDTDYCLVVQADGYVTNPRLWEEAFFDYDFIGAPWPVSQRAYIDPFGVHQRVGNGGFSLRSKKLLEVPLSSEVPWEVNSGEFYRHMDAGSYAEDGNICVHNRHIYVEAGCKFAPLEVAIRFSREHAIPEFNGLPTFGFHGVGRTSKISRFSSRYPAVLRLDRVRTIRSSIRVLQKKKKHSLRNK